MTTAMQTFPKQAEVTPERPRLVSVGILVRHLNAIGTWTAIGAVATHILMWLLHASEAATNLPLVVALAIGAPPLVIRLGRKLLQRQFGTDLLAGVSVITAILLKQYLAGTFIVLML